MNLQGDSSLARIPPIKSAKSVNYGKVNARKRCVAQVMHAVYFDNVNVLRAEPVAGPRVNESERIATVLEAVIAVVGMGDTKRVLLSKIGILCVVPAGQTYCGQWCEEAGSENVEIACECDHLPASPLTASERRWLKKTGVYSDAGQVGLLLFRRCRAVWTPTSGLRRCSAKTYHGR